MKYYLFLLCAFACQASQAPVEVPTPLPTPYEAGTIVDCDEACAKLRAFDCQAGFAPDGGSRCEEICTEAISSGYLYWPSECVRHASTKTEIQLCGVTCN